MSGLANLFNVPGSPEEAASWAFAHAANHRDISRAIYNETGVTLPEYVLDPIPLHDMGSWVYQHQQMHADMDSILGISGLNLLNVEWQDEASLAGFIQANASEHRQACNLLGIA